MSRVLDYSLLVERRCSACKVTKPVAEFNRYTDPSQPINGWRYYSTCRTCQNDASRSYGSDNKPRRNERLRNWRGNNPEAARAKDRRARLMSHYGITEPEAEALFQRFDGLCWLCRLRPARGIDHCHTSGRVRGALCDGCNSVVMERVDADPDFLARVAAYATIDGCSSTTSASDSQGSTISTT